MYLDKSIHVHMSIACKKIYLANISVVQYTNNGLILRFHSSVVFFTAQAHVKLVPMSFTFVRVK